MANIGCLQRTNNYLMGPIIAQKDLKERTKKISQGGFSNKIELTTKLLK